MRLLYSYHQIKPRTGEQPEILERGDARQKFSVYLEKYILSPVRRLYRVCATHSHKTACMCLSGVAWGNGWKTALVEYVIVSRAAVHNGIVNGAEKPRNAVQYLSPVGKGRGILYPLWRLSGASRRQRRIDPLKARSAGEHDPKSRKHKKCRHVVFSRISQSKSATMPQGKHISTTTTIHRKRSEL